ncbi:MAG: alpha/beta hydrolase [Acidimicrobiia bacterium]|nr:alpha/beta hydrolase [Acidimicrobiia bacterium]
MIDQIVVDSTTTLEARWDLPQAPRSLIVFCHPHPLQGGTMTAPLLEKIVARLVEVDLGVLRFNFRGIGGSTGTWSDGVGEVDDVAAAVQKAQSAHPQLDLSLIGWSFGAATALCWQARDQAFMPYVGIAPPVESDLTPPLPDGGSLAPARRKFILGDRDQFVTVEALTAYADEIGAEIEILKASDHFFYFREDKVARAIIDFLDAPASG